MQPITIYKYASLNSAIRIIKNSSVLLNTPDNFNDPFDCIINITEEEKQKVLDLTINYFTFKVFCDFIKRDDLNLTKSQKALFKTIKLEVAAYTKLIRKTKTYTMLPFFNDMVNHFAEVNEDILAAKEAAKAKLENEIIPSLESMRLKARISCFSSINDSILMWSHYGDSHRGVCFEFEENRDFFKKVRYSNKRVNISLSDAISRVLAFDFINERLSYQDKKFSNIMLEPLYTKSKEWSYENEIRCVLSDTEPHTSGFLWIDGKNFIQMKITKIYIGTKAYGDNLSELLYLAKNRKIPVVFMKEDENNFAIVPDYDKKMIGKHEPIVSKNILETYIDEIHNCLDNQAYVGAMSCALTIPGIMGKLIYPDLSYRDAYINWYEENIGQYNNSWSTNMPYLSGEVCFKLKSSIHDYGVTNGVQSNYGMFKIDGLRLLVEDKNYYDAYNSNSFCEENTKGEKCYFIDISIRDFCIKVINMANNSIQDNPELMNRLAKANLRFFSKEVKQINENTIRVRNYFDI